MEKCSICGKGIDKSDPGHTWVTMTRKEFWTDIGTERPETRKIPTERITLCEKCGLPIWQKAQELMEEAEEEQRVKQLIQDQRLVQ